LKRIVGKEVGEVKGGEEAEGLAAGHLDEGGGF
jgi:hypothetical protein